MKQKPKQRLEKYSERFDNDESPIGNPETWGKRIVEPKQETTLEKAAKKYDGENAHSGRTSFIEGAKWQAEGMYSYDELRKIAYNAFCFGQLYEPTEGKYNLWIQQFKKK